MGNTRVTRLQKSASVLAHVVMAMLLSGCSGPQSALDPAGLEAEHVAQLFWVMLIGAALVWAIVIGAAVFAGRFQNTPISEKAGLRIVLWAGAVFPTIVLAALLIFGLRLLPVLRAPGADMTIEVSGEQFWWRVTYHPEGRPAVASANEIRLPVGASVEFVLTAPDVIHSFWIPSLGGKIDMIPGRTNRLILKPTKVGTYRGACAEFCGESHALMAFPIIVMQPAEFTAWLERESADASSPVSPAAFLANGCGGCHTVKGTEANGVIGPDLTHIASRQTIGAGILPNTPEHLGRFIAATETIKPGSRMPSFGMLPAQDAASIVAYLGSLR